MKFLITTLIALTFAITANASSSRFLDGQFITNGANTLTIPAASDTLTANSTTDTLINKSMSGAANTFTLIPVGAIGNGSVLSGTNTGDVTLGTANGLSLLGQAISLQLSTSGQPGSLSAADWTTFNGKLTSPLTTKGDVLVYSTTNDRLPVGTNGQILTADSAEATGLKWIAPPSVAPNVVGSTGTPTLITAGGGISFSGSNYSNINFIAGNAGPINVTANPQVAAGSSVGQRLTLVGEHATNTVTLEDGTGLSLNGMWVGGLQSVLELMWDGTVWVETARR